MDANATHSDRVAFYLTGRRAEGLRDVGALRPALQARYRDLSSLRHDFPLVLATSGDAAAPSLTALVDAALASIAKGVDAERTRRQVLRVEQEVRVLLQHGAEGTLGTLWSDAVERLAAGRDASFAEAARRARAAIAVDGPLLRCDAELPERLLQHVWQQAQQRKGAALRERLVRLIQQLSDILRADFEHSGAGRNATRLKASVGSGHDGLFDFEAMSRVLAHAIPRQSMPEARRERIRRLLGVLDAQPFVALPDESAARVAGNEAYGYRFASCAAALAAWNERLPRLVELARAIEVAELEIDGRYRPERHDALFASYGANGLEPDMLSRFPDVLVCLDGTSLDAAEQTRLMEILAGEVPIKVLYRVDDLLAAPDDALAPTSPGLRCRQIAHMAMGLNQVYVMHVAASHLPRCGERIGDAMRFAGPALFCVYSGASAATAGQSTYLAAAGAMESRAFPAFVYDPSGGPDWASRFHLDDNPQRELDWPIHRFEYEDARHRRVSVDLAFTFVDFAAGDARFALHLARLPSGSDESDLAPIDEMLLRDAGRLPERIPCVRMIEERDRLHTVVIDERMLRKARRSREMWQSLQELGGVHNSHANRLLERERAAWEASHAAAAAAAPAPGAMQGQAATTALLAEAAAPEPVAAAPSRDDAYIETVRCSTCNECTQINPKMFAYDANKQAYIADLKAGTYAQLVEAAESCQVSVIHPGKPQNPDETGLAELLVRAEAFR
jgi:ferredoxin